MFFICSLQFAPATILTVTLLVLFAFALQLLTPIRICNFLLVTTRHLSTNLHSQTLFFSYLIFPLAFATCNTSLILHIHVPDLYVVIVSFPTFASTKSSIFFSTVTNCSPEHEDLHIYKRFRCFEVYWDDVQNCILVMYRYPREHASGNHKEAYPKDNRSHFWYIVLLLRFLCISPGLSCLKFSAAIRTFGPSFYDSMQTPRRKHGDPIDHEYWTSVYQATRFIKFPLFCVVAILLEKILLTCGELFEKKYFNLKKTVI